MKINEMKRKKIWKKLNGEQMKERERQKKRGKKGRKRENYEKMGK